MVTGIYFWYFILWKPWDFSFLALKHNLSFTCSIDHSSHCSPHLTASYTPRPVTHMSFTCSMVHLNLCSHLFLILVQLVSFLYCFCIFILTFLLNQLICSPCYGDNYEPLCLLIFCFINPGWSTLLLWCDLFYEDVLRFEALDCWLEQLPHGLQIIFKSDQRAHSLFYLQVNLVGVFSLLFKKSVSRNKNFPLLINVRERYHFHWYKTDYTSPIQIMICELFNGIPS